MALKNKVRHFIGNGKVFSNVMRMYANILKWEENSIEAIRSLLCDQCEAHCECVCVCITVWCLYVLSNFYQSNSWFVGYLIGICVYLFPVYMLWSVSVTQINCIQWKTFKPIIYFISCNNRIMIQFVAFN